MSNPLYDPSPYRPGTSGWTGQIGRIAFINGNEIPVLVRLYHPDAPDQVFENYQVQPGANIFLANNANIGMDWGIQVDNSRIRIVGLVSDWNFFDGANIFQTWPERIKFADSNSFLNEAREDIFNLINSVLTTAPPSGTSGRREPIEKNDRFFLTIDLPGQAIDVVQFNNAWSPDNLNGSTTALENFSLLVNGIPFLSRIHSLTEYSLEKIYEEIVEAKPQTIPSKPEDVATYEKAYNFLYADAIDIDSTTGKTIQVKIESSVYRNYLNKEAAYKNAYQAYITAFQQYSTLDAPKWSLLAPELQRKVDITWTELQNARANEIESALAILRQAPVSTVATMLSNAKKIWENTKRSSLSDPFVTWHPTYAFPNNWLDDSATNNFSQVTTDTISFKFARVEIRRPWFNPSILSLNGWSVPGRQPGSYSTGTIEGNDGIFSLIPVRFIIARDINIKALVNRQPTTALSQPGPQIIGWINRIVPFCPPELSQERPQPSRLPESV